MSQEEKKNRSSKEELTEAQRRSRRQRNIWLAVAIGFFMTLIYVVTLVKLGKAAHPPSLSGR